MSIIQQFFEADDYLALRRESYNFIVDFLNTCEKNTSLLEIGPTGVLDPNTPYPEWDSSSVIKKYCNKNNILYKTCDILPGCDYICNIEQLSSINCNFDYIIANHVLEHVENIWLIKDQIISILNKKMLVITPFLFKIHGPNPDCWRISPAGYRRLFDGCNLEFDSYPKNQCDKNGMPLLIKVVIS